MNLLCEGHNPKSAVINLFVVLCSVGHQPYRVVTLHILISHYILNSSAVFMHRPTKADIYALNNIHMVFGGHLCFPSKLKL